jgi:mono/diheme cytochrome c family protein
MKQDQTEHRAIVVSTMSPAIFVALTFFVVSILQAAIPAPDAAAASATFRTKCAMCHGQDGAGSTVGKSMNVPDLRSPVVQKQTDAQLAQIISDGKSGMPAFKSSLSEDEIHALVAHLRLLHRKK